MKTQYLLPGVPDGLLGSYAVAPFDFTLVGAMADAADENGEGATAGFLRWCSTKHVMPYPDLRWETAEDVFPWPDETVEGWGWNRHGGVIADSYPWRCSVLPKALSDAYDRVVGRDRWWVGGKDGAAEALGRALHAWRSLPDPTPLWKTRPRPLPKLVLSAF